MKIEQGNIYWYSMPSHEGRISIPHPCVVIQDTVINQSRIATTVVCGITSNRRKFAWPGFVLLDPGEGNLTKKSVVDVSQVLVIPKNEMGEYIGRLSQERIQEIFAGMRLIQGFHPQSE